jgi:cyanophycin synthetase
LDGFATYCVALNKPLTYHLLQEARLPVPRHLAFGLGTVDAAIGFLKAANGPCVVKPASGTGGGWGVTTGVRRVSELRRAAATARVYGPQIIVEEQIAGENYRLLFLDGKLLDAVARHPPHVVADGRSTVAELVHQVNRQRLAVSTPTSPRLVPLDLDLRFTLRDQGLTLSSRPPRGTRVILKTVINDNDTSDNETVTGRLDQALVAECARAVEAVGVRLAGVDVITEDLSRSLAETSGRIIEVNTSPGYQWHYHKREGATPVARHVLRRMIEHHQSEILPISASAN